MLDIALANINSFASAPYPTTADDTLNQILQRQQNLEQRVSDLETEVRNLKDELSISKADNCKLRAEVHELQKRVATLEDMGEAQEMGEEEALESFHNLQKQLNELSEITALERALDRQRITKLEQPAQPEPTTKTTGHIEKLYSLMVTNQVKQLSFSQAGKMLGLSRVRIHQLKLLIASSDKFVLVKDPHHKQRLLIRVKYAR